MDTPSKHPGRNGLALGTGVVALTVALGLGAGTALRTVLPEETEGPIEEPTTTTTPEVALTPDAGSIVPPAEPQTPAPVVALPNETSQQGAPPPRPRTMPPPVRATPPPRRVVRIRTRSS